MQSESTAPFPHLNAALKFYLTKNPARQKFMNLLEQTNSNSYHSDFEPYHPHRLWARVAKYLDCVLKVQDDVRRDAFERCVLDDAQALLSYEEAGIEFGKSPKTIARWIREIREELEDCFVRAGLVEPDHYAITDYRKNGGSSNGSGANGTSKPTYH